MGSLRDEINQYLEELRDAAGRVEGYADNVKDAARRLQSAAGDAITRLTEREDVVAMDELRDGEREVSAMTHELGRLSNALMNIQRDCERV